MRRPGTHTLRPGVVAGGATVVVIQLRIVGKFAGNEPGVFDGVDGRFEFRQSEVSFVGQLGVVRI